MKQVFYILSAWEPSAHLKGYSTMAWTPFFLKMTILWTGPQLLQMVYRTSCAKMNKQAIINHNYNQWNTFWNPTNEAPGGYRGDGVDGVHDGEEQDVVDGPGVVRVSRPWYFLAGGVVDEGWVACNVHLVVRGIGHGSGRPVHVLVLHQGLALLGHHNHIATTQNTKKTDEALETQPYKPLVQHGWLNYPVKCSQSKLT